MELLGLSCYIDHQVFIPMQSTNVWRDGQVLTLMKQELHLSSEKTSKALFHLNRRIHYYISYSIISSSYLISLLISKTHTHTQRFHYMAMADNRQRFMPLPDDRLPGRGQPLAYPEAVLLVDPIEPEFKGEVYIIYTMHGYIYYLLHF